VSTVAERRERLERKVAKIDRQRRELERRHRRAWVRLQEVREEMREEAA
jgi:hypothetical protein